MSNHPLNPSPRRRVASRGLALLLAARACAGELVLLDAPASVPRVLRTGRYAPIESAAADADRGDVDGRVVFVPQPARGSGCPTYARAAVAGRLVLERAVRTDDCSIRERVALAATAGAVGWLHELFHTAGSVVVPGFEAYRLNNGDAALLALAPPAVDIAQTSDGLDWLVAAAEAGTEPRVSLRLREPDEWARARASGWMTLWQTLVALCALAALELAVCQLHAVTVGEASAAAVLQRMSMAPAGNLARSSADALAAPAVGARGGGRTPCAWVSAPWPVGRLVLVACILSSGTALVYAAVDPMWSFGRFAFTTSLALLYTPAALALVSQILQLTYVHETVTAGGGIESLHLFGAYHKAVAAIGLALVIVTEAALFALRSQLPGGSVLLALGFVGPALLALACCGLLRTVQRVQAGAASRALQHKLRRLALANSVIACLALPLSRTYASPFALAISFVTAIALLSILYVQVEQIAAVGVRPIRGPLRWLFEYVRDQLCQRRAGGRSLVAAVSPTRTLADIAELDAAPTAVDSPRSTARTPSFQPTGATSAAPSGAYSARPSLLRAGPDAASGAANAIGDSHLALGVSLACLRDFARAHGVTAQQTTAEVVALVRAQTAASRLSFAEQRADPRNGDCAASDGAPAVGRASVFVSHAQACRFLKLLDALETHLEMHKLPREQTCFWLDLMCIRQHEVAADVSRIGDVVESIGTVAVVLDPWDKPLCLERVWCLYEIAQTVRSDGGDAEGAAAAAAIAFAAAAAAAAEVRNDGEGAQPAADPSMRGSPSARVRPLDSLARMVRWSIVGVERPNAQPRVKLCLTMAPRERLRLVHAVRTTSRAQIERALTSFDCRTAGASVEADRQRILAHIASKFAPAHDASQHSNDDVAGRAYENFNARVQLAIREAVASFSHIDANNRSDDWRPESPCRSRRVGTGA